MTTERPADSVTLLTGSLKKLFQEALDFFDEKHYDEGLEAVKLVREQEPKNWESLALEGLLIHSLHRKSEGYDKVKLALQNSMRQSSDVRQVILPFCFRVYALMYKEDRDYPAAKRSFLNALRYDPSNVVVLRDLAHVEFQLRDFSSHLSHRIQLIEIQPSLSRNWLWLALGLHLQGRFSRAASIIDNWVSFQDEEIRQAKDEVTKMEKRVKKSRVLLYRLVILFEGGLYADVLRCIVEDENRAADPNLLHHKEVGILRGRSLLKLGRRQEAETVFLAELEKNPDEMDSLTWYLRSTLSFGAELPEHQEQEQEQDLDLLNEKTCRAIFDNEEKVVEVMRVFQRLAERFPRAKIFHRLTLAVLSVDSEESIAQFREKFSEYVIPFLRKTVPPTFDSLKELCDDPTKVRIIEEIMQSFRVRLEESQKLFEDQTEQEPPSALLWVLLFLTKLLDRLRRCDEALEMIELAIDHTPTLLQLYMTKARILRHLGRVADARDAMELARNLDLADRFVNTKAVKYLLANGEIESAREVAYIFANDYDESFNLHRMQGTRYEYRLGLAYWRLGLVGRAIREFDRVRNFFHRINFTTCDFYDFHMRNCSLLSLLQAIRFADVVRNDPYYVKATKATIECYVELVDVAVAEDSTRYTNMIVVSPESRDSADRIISVSTDDMEAVMAATVGADPLDVSRQRLQELESLTPRDPEIYVLEAKVFERMKKPLLLLRAIRKLQQLSPDHSSLKPSFAALRKLLTTCTQRLDPRAVAVIHSELAKDGEDEEPGENDDEEEGEAGQNEKIEDES